MTRVKYNQRGYSSFSMSLRALKAYENDEMPLSKWTKKEILSAIDEFFGEAIEKSELEKIITYFQKLNLSVLREFFLNRSSWHHTGAYANKTNFYKFFDNYLNDLFDDEGKFNSENFLNLNRKNIKGTSAPKWGRVCA